MDQLDIFKKFCSVRCPTGGGCFQGCPYHGLADCPWKKNPTKCPRGCHARLALLKNGGPYTWPELAEKCQHREQYLAWKARHYPDGGDEHAG